MYVDSLIYVCEEGGSTEVVVLNDQSADHVCARRKVDDGWSDGGGVATFLAPLPRIYDLLDGLPQLPGLMTNLMVSMSLVKPATWRSHERHHVAKDLDWGVSKGIRNLPLVVETPALSFLRREWCWGSLSYICRTASADFDDASPNIFKSVVVGPIHLYMGRFIAWW